MKEKMKKEMTIKYYWEREDNLEIPDAHKGALEEDAEARIFFMVKEGFWCGELRTTVRYGKDIVPEEDEDNGVEYSGEWWLI